LVYLSQKGGDSKMASVFDVAKYILEKQGSMSTWKLQKLCYYAQAWSLGWDGLPIFQEDFEAWTNGPVCRQLFIEHKGQFDIDAEDLRHGDSTCLSSNDIETIDSVLRFYGDKQPYWLREQTHIEDPWLMARNGIPNNAPCDAIITKPSMGEYYQGL
jgi:uncharacterized phage-associated protein